MRFEPTPLLGTYVVAPAVHADDRGWFARVFCARLFREHGLVDSFVQVNHSRSESSGTIRGLHYQVSPLSEVKLVRCTRGAIFDVFVDMRKGSPTFLKWFGVELTEVNRKVVYVPVGFAHGFQALQPGSEITYQSSTEYSPTHERQVRFDDPKINIDWPIAAVVLSPKDAATEFLKDDFVGVSSS